MFMLSFDVVVAVDRALIPSWSFVFLGVIASHSVDVPVQKKKLFAGKKKVERVVRERETIH